jgi:hypothetical protein
MPVPATVPGRAVNIGLAKQSALGTAVPPSSSVGYWIRWLQGSKVRPDASMKQEYEGDGNRGQSLNYKDRQSALGKLICYPRPTEAAVFMQAFSGSGSDAITAATGLVGTSTAVTSTGSQSFTVTASAGALTNVTNGSQLTFDIGKSNAETVTLTAWNSTTGAGTATFVNTHTGTPTVAQPATHVITPQNSGTPSYYTLGQNTGSVAGNRLYQQAVDCLLNQLHITAGITAAPIKFDADWVGLTNSQSTTQQTTALPVDGPFYWYSGTWTINSALIGGSAQNWAVAVKDLSVTLNNNVNPEDFMAETITPGTLTMENLSITGDLTLLWQDGGMFAAAYFNGGTADSSLIASGQLQFVFASSTDSQQTWTLNIPNASLTMSEIEPDLSGKPIEQKASFVALRPSTGSIYTSTHLISSTAGMSAL